LLLAPFRPEQWMTALELLAGATHSSHAELIGGERPNRIPIKLISNLSDSSAELIRAWDESMRREPVQNPMLDRGWRTGILEIVSDDEVISRDDRKHHRVWNEYYNKIDMPHMCFTSLWRDGDRRQLVLSLMRSHRDGPIGPGDRKVFAVAARAWRDAANMSRALKQEGTRVLAGAFDSLDIAAAVLDGFGSCASLSPAAEAVVRDGRLFRLRMGNLELVGGAVGKAECPLAGGPIRLDAALQPCVGCVTRSGVSGRGGARQSCAIRISRPQGGAVELRLSPLPRTETDLGFGAAAIIVIEQNADRTRAELAAEIAATLTPAERRVALDMLNGQRPAEIAAHRRVTVETVRSQLKRIYAKAGVAGAIEFVAKARR
jgi:DNA-binding CsgD family transcriptional regulator